MASTGKSEEQLIKLGSAYLKEALHPDPRYSGCWRQILARSSAFLITTTMGVPGGRRGRAMAVYCFVVNTEARRRSPRQLLFFFVSHLDLEPDFLRHAQWNAASLACCCDVRWMVRCEELGFSHDMPWSACQSFLSAPNMEPAFHSPDQPWSNRSLYEVGVLKSSENAGADLFARTGVFESAGAEDGISPGAGIVCFIWAVASAVGAMTIAHEMSPNPTVTP
jgi:hypothetical protein